jgi:hypothetical protein
MSLFLILVPENPCLTRADRSLRYCTRWPDALTTSSDLTSVSLTRIHKPTQSHDIKIGSHVKFPTTAIPQQPNQAGAHSQLPRYPTHTCIKTHVQYRRHSTTPQLMPPHLPHFQTFHQPTKHKRKKKNQPPATDSESLPFPSPLKPHKFFPFSARRADPGEPASARKR